MLDRFCARLELFADLETNIDHFLAPGCYVDVDLAARSVVSRRRWIERHHQRPNDSVLTVVAESEAVPIPARVVQQAPPLGHHASDLEHVLEFGREGELESQVRRLRRVVVDRDPVV